MATSISLYFLHIHVLFTLASLDIFWTLLLLLYWHTCNVNFSPCLQPFRQASVSRRVTQSWGGVEMFPSHRGQSLIWETYYKPTKFNLRPKSGRNLNYIMTFVINCYIWVQEMVRKRSYYRERSAPVFLGWMNGYLTTLYLLETFGLHCVEISVDMIVMVCMDLKGDNHAIPMSVWREWGKPSKDQPGYSQTI
jgi:hypothetical protein